MNSKKVEALLSKYWNGESSLVEEKELKSFFNSAEGTSHKDAVYFNHLHNKVSRNPLDESFNMEVLDLIQGNASEQKTKSIFLQYWYVAATLVLIISVSIIFKNKIFVTEVPSQIVQIDTYEDPEKAFEETKKALMFLSSKLNQSSEYATQFSKFEQSQKIIKQAGVAGTN